MAAGSCHPPCCRAALPHGFLGTRRYVLPREMCKVQELVWQGRHLDLLSARCRMPREQNRWRHSIVQLVCYSGALGQGSPRPLTSRQVPRSCTSASCQGHTPCLQGTSQPLFQPEVSQEPAVFHLSFHAASFPIQLGPSSSPIFGSPWTLLGKSIAHFHKTLNITPPGMFAASIPFSSLLPFLQTGMMLTSCQSAGTSPDSQDLW